jgi:hypothetical protein
MLLKNYLKKSKNMTLSGTLEITTKILKNREKNVDTFVES